MELVRIALHMEMSNAVNYIRAVMIIQSVPRGCCWHVPMKNNSSQNFTRHEGSLDKRDSYVLYKNLKLDMMFITDDDN